MGWLGMDLAPASYVPNPWLRHELASGMVLAIQYSHAITLVIHYSYGCIKKIKYNLLKSICL
jgi:hypothetical protein